MNTPHRDIWTTYTESWKVDAKEEKMALFEQCLDPACEYTDPLVQARGWQQLIEYMVDFHRQVPGGHFVTTWFLAHHQRSIAKWEMRNGENQPMGEGISYGTYNDHGKLLSMNGFFETP